MDDPMSELQRAHDLGIHCIIAATEPSSWPRIRALHPHASIALGTHPWWAVDQPELPEPTDLVAIGEIGLDGVRGRVSDTQVACFRAQLAHARAVDLPVILHGARAWGPLLDILRRDGLPQAGGVAHGWSASLELTKQALGLGLHLGFGALLLHPTAKKARAALEQTPSDRVLLETDSPESRVDSRAARVDDLRRLRGVLAGILGKSAPERADQNARELFRLESR